MKPFEDLQFLLVFFSYIVNSFGDWLNYVAALTIIDERLGYSWGSRKSLLTSAFMVVRLLPPLLLSPLTGSVADRYDKRWVMALSNVGSAVVVLGYLGIRSSAQLPAFFAVTFLQQALFALYDPTRRAVIPEIVNGGEGDLKIATTAEAFAFSLMMAVGSSVGGWLVGWGGVDLNFVLDAATYLVSAGLVMLVKPITHNEDKLQPLGAGEKTCCGSISEGASYLLNERQKDLRLVLTIKASAALCWGLAELLEVAFAEMPLVHQLGGLSATLGWIYAFSGLGCIIGPVAAGALTGTTEQNYRRALVVSFGLSAVSAFLLLVTNHVATVLISSFLRACASSVIWIYSTLLVQSKANPQYFGRVFATEMALFTASKTTGLVLGGVIIDVAGASSRGAAGIMLAISTTTFVLWWQIFRPGREGVAEDEVGTAGKGELDPLVSSSGPADKKCPPHSSP